MIYGESRYCEILYANPFDEFLYLLLIGASVSEPHTSESFWDFSNIIIILFLPYVVLYFF